MQQQGSETIEMSEPAGVLPNEVKPPLTSKCINFAYILHTFFIWGNITTRIVLIDCHGFRNISQLMISDDDIWSLFLLLNYYYSNEQRKFQYVGLIGLMGLIVIFTWLCLYESDIVGHKSQLYIKNSKSQNTGWRSPIQSWRWCTLPDRSFKEKAGNNKMAQFKHSIQLLCFNIVKNQQ